MRPPGSSCQQLPDGREHGEGHLGRAARTAGPPRRAMRMPAAPSRLTIATGQVPEASFRLVGYGAADRERRGRRIGRPAAPEFAQAPVAYVSVAR
ncbi:hypothetical protein PR003_g20371 [Phytophthora rubi]|uniref:Uncharacterized protein n=1 Tax=Phytophthora rubi TaxID=129364 RepID=A0A6A4DNM3_9STRA|nr:hypothetical protein PR003_g20371 [Phytophthora rubi]